MILLFLLPMGALAIPALSLFIKKHDVLQYLALFLLACVLALHILPQFNQVPDSYLFSLDALARFFNVVFLLVGIAVGLFAVERYREHGVVFSTMLLSGTAAMMFIAASRNLIGLFLGLELLSLSFYELCALRKNGVGLESAAKLFFTSILASALFILGAAFVWAVTQTFDLSQFLQPHSHPLFLTGAALILAAVSFKMSLFPFNLWLPDVYEGAPGEITALLAAGAKKAGFAAFLKLFIPMTYVKTGPAMALLPLASFSGAVALLSFLTMTFGNIAAMLQKNVKRMIAYSIIAHAGFLAIGLAASTPLGYTGLLFHIFVHALMASGAFLVLSILEKEGIHNLDDYNGLAKRAPALSLLLTIFLASLTGIPPLAGFFSKFLLWSSAVEAGYVWLAIAAIVNSALSTYFYFVILRRVWAFAPQVSDRLPVLTWNETPVVYALAAGLFLLGIYPDPILSWITRVVSVTIS